MSAAFLRFSDFRQKKQKSHVWNIFWLVNTFFISLPVNELKWVLELFHIFYGLKFFLAKAVNDLFYFHWKMMIWNLNHNRVYEIIFLKWNQFSFMEFCFRKYKTNILSFLYLNYNFKFARNSHENNFIEMKISWSLNYIFFHWNFNSNLNKLSLGWYLKSIIQITQDLNIN